MKQLFHINALSLFAAAAMAPEGVASAQEAVGLGLSGKVALVHKNGAEGVLQIDALTGQVVPGQHDRPEWAEGLVMANYAARHIFYAARLGDQNYTAEMRNPEVFAFEDLDWLALNMEDGEEVEIAADDEHRMNVLAVALGVDRETGNIKGVVAETEIASDQTRSAEELAALTSAQQERFAATGTGE